MSSLSSNVPSSSTTTTFGLFVAGFGANDAIAPLTSRHVFCQNPPHDSTTPGFVEAASARALDPDTPTIRTLAPALTPAILATFDTFRANEVIGAPFRSSDGQPPRLVQLTR